MIKSIEIKIPKPIVCYLVADEPYATFFKDKTVINKYKIIILQSLVHSAQM